MQINDIVKMYDNIAKTPISSVDEISSAMKSVDAFLGDLINSSDEAKRIVLQSETEETISKLRNMILKTIFSQMVLEKKNSTIMMLLYDEETTVSLIDTFFFAMLGVLVENEVL